MSNKPKQVLIIEPQNELRFRGPFTGTPIASYLKLKNQTSDQKIYFKIKTTVPRKYCVRPNSGLIKAKEECEVAVCLQPYNFDPKEKSKHKFMVQTYTVPEDDPDENVQEIWKDIKSDKFVDTKLKCIFENSGSTSTISKAKRTSKPDLNSTDGKSKINDDGLKSSPKAMNEVEEKFLQASQEVNRLRLEENNLREENLFLKEDVMKWKHAAMDNDTLLTSIPGLTSHPRNPLVMSTNSIIIAVIMVVIGYILGKFI
ncbi:PREDICTED: vesicle-associated membrane protein-associated protein A-like [Ceratosolen solmsi marchali]|uniref:Vesicle-associated membrane protein-associated protein A-like n=1 Tax=Ceratosolen solmsi marchali TaxID=326594 RepID=A0AAJ6VK53_9HYME|nr:PREDICTED: vesicle-associated membrane protein-associated protein A-like [Ceratosolen solmsi marchali]